MRINKIIRLVLIFSIIPLNYLPLSSQIVINEVNAMNYGLPFDDNFDNPDWIELYNTSIDPVNISGHRISDKNDFESAWELPSKLLDANEYILLFADGNNESSKQRLTLEASGHGVSTLWDYDGFRYEYLELEGDFEIQMRIHSFTDAHNYGAVGLALRTELTDRSKMVGIFCKEKEIRQYFTFIRELPNTILKEHKTTIKPEYPYCRIQLKKVGDTVFTNVVDITGFPLESKANYFPIEGKFYIGIALSSADRSRNCRAVISEIKLNGTELKGNDFKSVEWHLPIESKKYYSRELHTDFKLNIAGETVYLFDSEGKLIDELQYPALKANVSYGRDGSDSNIFGFFDLPTPAAANINSKEFICTPPDFSLKGGFFNLTQQVQLTPFEQNSRIYYTIDGSFPTDSSNLYTSPLIINKTTVVRAVAYNEFGIKSKDATYTFFIDHQGSLPIFSLSSDPHLLFSKEEGLLNDDNIWLIKQIPLHFELWENGENVYSRTVEAKLHGRRSRSFPQRSMRFYARKQYDTPDFNYDFFGENSLNKYEHIILRNGGSDWEETRIRDAFCSVLAQQFENLFAMEHKPVVAYINGEYWGIYNLRERLHERYLAEKFNISRSSINFMEYELLADHDVVVFGSSKSYYAIFDSLRILNMKEDRSIDVMSELVDLDNITDYTIFNSFLGNYDWPFNNTRFFSSNDLDGKWRWIIHDMDFTTGVWSTGTYNNVLKRALTPDTSTFSNIMIKLLENDDFRVQFINRYADLLNTKLRFENTVHVYDSLINEFEHEITRHKQRWPESLVDYEFRKKKTRDFLRGKS